MIKTVEKTIKKHNLIFRGARVLLALSGGSDSVCLLHILNSLKNKLGFELCAAHLNHSLRAEADSDSRFVAELCKTLGVECYVKKLDIKSMAKNKHISEELCGREERYKFFFELCEKKDIALIATAHNKNDAAETVLMHIIRGSGIDGLSGIAYKRGNIIRPLLDADKSDIEKYCYDNGYEFVVDKTNSETIYTRNKIRIDLLPLICREFNPSFSDALIRNAEIMRDDASYMSCEAEKLYKKIVHDGRAEVSVLKNLDKAMRRRVIILMYREFTGTENNLQYVYGESMMELISRARSGSRVDLPKCEAAVESGIFYFRKKGECSKKYSYKLSAGVRTEIPEAEMFITLMPWNGNGEKFYFDDCNNIFVRSRLAGDVFLPVGMKGRKKLSDYFTDLKLPLSERNKIPIITYNDELVWVVGKRRDRRFIAGKKPYTFIIERQGGI